MFFYAVPSGNCSEPHNLYMRTDGAETVDIGAYKFLGANKEGNRLLLESSAHEILGYDTETRATKPPSSAELATSEELAGLGIPYQVDPEGALERGRYSYFAGGVNGVPGGANGTSQVYRYDSVEKSIECVSCASPFDPEPKYDANITDHESNSETRDATPDETNASANGDYVFFPTNSALVPKDVDGEVELRIPRQGNESYIHLLQMCMSGAGRT